MKKAICIGINNYKNAPLPGCQEDAADAMAYLKTRGYTCTTLLGSLATKATMLSKIKALFTGAKAGDSFVVFFSGHGSQVPDVSGDEADGLDEVLVPYDYYLNRWVSDDDLRGIFAGLPAGIILYVILDCCHSGTGTRNFNPDTIVKSIPYVAKGKPPAVRKAFVPVPGLNHVLISGCMASQTSLVIKVDGKPRGALTYFLMGELRSNPTLCNADIVAKVESDLLALGITDQTPQLEATEEKALQMPFT